MTNIHVPNEIKRKAPKKRKPYRFERLDASLRSHRSCQYLLGKMAPSEGLYKKPLHEAQTLLTQMVAMCHSLIDAAHERSHSIAYEMLLTEIYLSLLKKQDSSVCYEAVFPLEVHKEAHQTQLPSLIILSLVELLHGLTYRDTEPSKLMAEIGKEPSKQGLFLKLTCIGWPLVQAAWSGCFHRHVKKLEVELWRFGYVEKKLEIRGGGYSRMESLVLKLPLERMSKNSSFKKEGT